MLEKLKITILKFENSTVLEENVKTITITSSSDRVWAQACFKNGALRTFKNPQMWCFKCALKNPQKWCSS